MVTQRHHDDSAASASALQAEAEVDQLRNDTRVDTHAPQRDISSQAILTSLHQFRSATTLDHGAGWTTMLEFEVVRSVVCLQQTLVPESRGLLFTWMGLYLLSLPIQAPQFAL